MNTFSAISILLRVSFAQHPSSDIDALLVTLNVNAWTLSQDNKIIKYNLKCAYSKNGVHYIVMCEDEN